MGDPEMGCQSIYKEVNGLLSVTAFIDSLACTHEIFINVAHSKKEILKV